MEKMRTRFAPSPTGYMHIGNLRTALYAYLITKHSDGEFILRIEDTDQKREVAGATKIIYDVLKDTGLQFDEGPDFNEKYGPYIQSKRLPIYQEYAKKLIELGGAHYCFCSDDEITKNREENNETIKDPCHHLSKLDIEEKLAAGVPYTIRQTIPTTGTTTFKDEVYGTIISENALLDEGVLLKSDGYPTYNFANVIDDHLMHITHVVRGNEYLSSTPKYNLIYQTFNWNIPKYIHLPPVMKDEKNKLSKRNGDASYHDLIQNGFLKEAVINYIALLGWSPSHEEEIFSLEQLVNEFSIERISKSPAIFDIDKLKWVNSVYIRNMTLEQFHQLALPYYKHITRDIDLLELSLVLQPRILTFNEIYEQIDFIENTLTFDEALYSNKKMKTNPDTSLEALQWAIDKLEQIQDFTNDEEILHTFITIAKEHEVKNGQIMWPIRVALSNKTFTPGGAVEIVHILGKEETKKRITKAIQDLKKVYVE